MIVGLLVLILLVMLLGRKGFWLLVLLVVILMADLGSEASKTTTFNSSNCWQSAGRPCR